MPKRHAKKRKIVEELPDAASSDSDGGAIDDDRIYDASDRWHREQDRLILRDNSDNESLASGEERVPIAEHEEVFGLSDDAGGTDDDEDQYEELKEAHDRFMSRHRDELKRKDVRRELADGDDDDDDVQARRSSFAKKSEMAKTMNWGKKRDAYYEADFDKRKDAFRFRTNEQVGSSEEDDEQLDEAQLEEREALAIQKRLAEPLDAQADLLVGLGLGSSKRSDSKTNDTRQSAKQLEAVSVNLEGLSIDEQLRLIKRESPELSSLVREAHRVLVDLRTNWWPLLHAVNANGTDPQSRPAGISAFGVDYIRLKCELQLSYVLNLTFYLMLKSRRAPNVQAHPVIARVVELRTLLKQSDSLDDLHASSISQLQECVRAGGSLPFESEPKRKSVKKVSKQKRSRAGKKRLAGDDSVVSETQATSNQGSPIKHVHFADENTQKKPANGREQKTRVAVPAKRAEPKMSEKTTKKEEELEFNEDGTPAKRKISREMEKNRGLTPKRAKHYRNPRVRHRVQFRKATIRRRGQVRQVRSEMSPYGGELSGINMAVRKSTRLA